MNRMHVHPSQLGGKIRFDNGKMYGEKSPEIRMEARKPREKNIIERHLIPEGMRLKRPGDILRSRAAALGMLGLMAAGLVGLIVTDKDPVQDAPVANRNAPVETVNVPAPTLENGGLEANEQTPEQMAAEDESATRALQEQAIEDIVDMSSNGPDGRVSADRE